MMMMMILHTGVQSASHAAVWCCLVTLPVQNLNSKPLLWLLEFCQPREPQPDRQPKPEVHVMLYTLS
jgi:hypothetical protein